MSYQFYEEETLPVKGVKHDQGKPRFDLVDAAWHEEVARVLTFGAFKYEPHNWRKGIAYSRLIAATERHINAIKKGETHDLETGLLHAAHASCCLMFLSNFQLHEGNNQGLLNDLPTL